MNTQLYVGVTGVTSIQEARAVSEAFIKAGFTKDASHIGMIGYLINSNTLRNSHKGNRRYVTLSEFSQLLLPVKGLVLPMVHYWSQQPDDLASEVAQIFTETDIYNQGLCRAIQFNNTWLESSSLYDVKDNFPEMVVVLPLTGRIINNSNKNEIIKKLDKYGSVVDYVLIDPSEGKGNEFDLDQCISLYNAINKSFPQFTIGLAGGFGPENTSSRIHELKERLGTNFCIDAEGKLRDKKSEKPGDGDLNLEKVTAYLSAASAILS